MTQPPLSRQIQKLEAEIGAQLFDRSNRQVHLTTVGEQFLERARQILALSDRSFEAARAAARGEEGTLAIGFTAASAVSVLGSLVALIRDQLPRIEIDLRERVSGQQLTEIERGTLDLGLVRAPAADPDLHHRQLLAEDLVIALPTDHPLAGEGGIDIKRLSGHPMIGYSRKGAEYFRRKIDQLVDGRAIPVAFEVTQILSMLSLVAAGAGFALVPRSTQRLHLEGVAYRELALAADQTAAACVEIHAVWSARSQNPAVHRVLSLLEQQPLDVTME